MAKLFDRVKVNVPTTGTGDIEFGAAVSTAFLTPVEAGALDGNEVRYVIVDGLDFEEGLGLIKDTVATMERTVTKSKIGGTVGTSKINLSGTAVLALTASAADILTQAMGLHADANLADVEDADEALDNLGGTVIGKTIFTAADADAARAAIGESPTERQNAALSQMRISKLMGTAVRYVNAWATGLKAATDADRGINTGSSSNVDVSQAASGGYVKPTSSVVQQIPTMTGSTTSGVTMSASDVQTGYDAYKAADGAPVNAVNSDYASNAAPSTGTPITLTVDFGSGNAKTISSYQLAASAYASSGFNTYMAKDWKLQGSNDNSNWTDLDTQAGAAAWGLGETRTYNFANATAYRYYRWRFTDHQGGSLLIIGRVTLSAVIVADMTLTTLSQATDSNVGKARATIEFDNVDTPTLNTDLTAEVTCDGGTNWSAATLSAVTAYSQGGRSVAETADTACTTGTSFAMRLKTANGKDVPIHGVAIAVR